MEKQTKILIGIGAAIAAYLILKPKKAVSETNTDPSKIGLTYQSTANQGDVILFKTTDGVLHQGIAAGIQGGHDFNNADDWVNHEHYSGFDIIGVYSKESPISIEQFKGISSFNPPTGLKPPKVINDCMCVAAPCGCGGGISGGYDIM